MAQVTRRHFLRGMAAAGSIGALATAATKAPAQPRGVTLRALVYPYPPTKAIRDTLPEYEKQTGVKVEWEDVPYAELLSKHMAELIAKSGRYDLFNINNRWVAPQAGTGQLLALDDLLAKAGAELDWQDFMPKQKQMFSYKGKTYAIPLSCNTTLCAYRRDVFEQEGITLPPPGASFPSSEWMSIVKRLTRDGRKGTSFNTQPMQVPSEHWSSVLLSAGGRWFDEKLTPTFNSKEGLLAAEWMRELMQYAPKDILRYTNVETNEAMMSGEVLTQTIQWASRIPMVEDKAKSKVVGKVRWTTLPFAGWVPTRKVGLSVNDGWSFAIPKASTHPREAFDFAVWCVGKDKQLKLISELQVPPARRSVFDRPELHEKYVWLPTMKTQLDNAYDFPAIPEWPEILEKVGAEIHAGWAGQYPLPKALDRANELVAQLLKERNYPVGTWRGPKLPWE
ncbi:MAG TPA: extracellular solute-binding protein [Candidatus Methylomirabilis sp.]|nr:extracellular solute-binding protein [Candidatus Methylomirabilis sp.]HSC71195.1 extracellular solute-binding protein [Candidatus Methylomirabilis sp.]